MTPLSERPDVLTATDMAEIYQRSLRAIERLVRLDSRAIPMPFMTRPARWRKADVERHLGLTSTVKLARRSA